MKKLKCRVVTKPQQKGKEMDKLFIVCYSKKEESKVLKKLEKQGKKWSNFDKPTEGSYFSKTSKEYAIVVIRDIIYCTANATKSMLFYANTKKISAAEFLKENKETIVIYRNGAETIALEKNTGRKAVAKCHADDTYSFEIGAKLALERLLENYKPEEKPQEKREQYYTGKVVCVEGDIGYTVGRIYEIKDGTLKDDDGVVRPTGKSSKIRKLEDYIAAKFIELVE